MHDLVLSSADGTQSRALVTPQPDTHNLKSASTSDPSPNAQTPAQPAYLPLFILGCSLLPCLALPCLMTSTRTRRHCCPRATITPLPTPIFMYYWTNVPVSPLNTLHPSPLLCDPNRSWTSTLTPPMSRSSIPPCLRLATPLAPALLRVCPTCCLCGMHLPSRALCTMTQHGQVAPCPLSWRQVV
jgi:hypothetical protein